MAGTLMHLPLPTWPGESPRIREFPIFASRRTLPLKGCHTEKAPQQRNLALVIYQ
jgi:hypothetical protein